MFRRTVNPDSREADYACDRRTVYDGAATCLEHLGDFVLHRKPDAFDIDVHHRIEVGFSMIDKRRLHVTFDAGVVEGEIETAAYLHGMLDQRLNLGCNHDVGPLEAGYSTGLMDYRHCFLATLDVAITDHDLRPFAGKRHRRRATDSRSAASYQCNF